VFGGLIRIALVHLYCYGRWTCVAPLWDMVLVGSLNRGQWDPDADFIATNGKVWLSDAGRRRAIGLFEARLDETWKHPVIGYSLSYARALELEARLLEKEWSGEPGLFARMRVTQANGRLAADDHGASIWWSGQHRELSRVVTSASDREGGPLGCGLRLAVDLAGRSGRRGRGGRSQRRAIPAERHAGQPGRPTDIPGRYSRTSYEKLSGRNGPSASPASGTRWGASNSAATPSSHSRKANEFTEWSERFSYYIDPGLKRDLNGLAGWHRRRARELQQSSAFDREHEKLIDRQDWYAVDHDVLDRWDQATRSL
jgi:hypothetical protein